MFSAARSLAIAPSIVTAAVLATAPAALAGPTTFSSASFDAAGRPRAIVAADFNRDGRIDLATGGTGTASIGVLLNDTKDGAGFHLVADIPVGGGPFDLASGDLNGDGAIDIVVANADSDAVTILLGRGDGTFAPKRDVAIGGNPRGIAVADMNGDGRPDILVTQYARNAWLLLAGDGAGGVATTRTFATAARPQGILAADVNQDGAPDAVIANTGIARLSVYYGPGQSATTRQDVTIPVPVNVLAAGDFNRDGWIDVAGASTARSTGVVLRGSANGLGTPATIGTGSSPRGVATVDLNQDGRLDLAFANRGSSTVTVRLGNGNGAFGSALTLPGGSGSRALAAADFDADGRVDLATANEFDSTVTFFTNRSRWVTGGHVFSERLLGEDTGYGGPNALALADFDHDGRPDAATIGNPVPRIFFGSGAQLDLPGESPTDLAAADLNRDGHPDVVTTDFWQNAITVYLGDGAGAFAAPQRVNVLVGPQDLQLGDFNGDGRLDIVTECFDQTTGERTVHVLLGRADGRFTPWSSIAETTHSNGMVVGDFDRDGRLDLVTDEFSPSGLRVRYGDGAGGWRAEDQFFALPDAAGDVRAADFNGDGRLDLVAPLWDRVVVLLAHGTGFDPPTAYAFSADYQAYWYRVGVGDFDLDGDIDIVTNEADVLVNEGDGTFVLSMFAGWGDRPVITDLTGDGVPDVLLSGSGWLRVLAGERNEANRPPTVSAGPDRTVAYQSTGLEFSVDARGSDPDQHDLRFEWRDDTGMVVGKGPSFVPATIRSGTYVLTVTAYDDRGGQASDTMTLTITPFTEIVMHPTQYGVALAGGWAIEQDATAADGLRLRHPDRGAAKLADPLANPTHYIEFSFRPDPTLTYKLWIRGKADRDSPYNDSVFVQFSGATDASGHRAWEIGTTSALVFNLEECSGCGLSGWGWEDDAWGAVNHNGRGIRFPDGGSHRIRIQTREDGLSIDQIVLSADKYRDTRPGSAKHDTTILPMTFWPDD